MLRINGNGLQCQYYQYYLRYVYCPSFSKLLLRFWCLTCTAQPSFLAYFELDTRPDALSLISTMNGLFQAGAFCGSIGINVVADRFGRKMSIIIPSILVLISGACLAGSVNVGMFIAFRFFSGMGSWWLLGSVPVWMSEVCRVILV